MCRPAQLGYKSTKLKWFIDKSIDRRLTDNNFNDQLIVLVVYQVEMPNIFWF